MAQTQTDDDDGDSLGTFEGFDVLAVSVTIGNAGESLGGALAVAPNVFHKGERVFVVMECEVTDVAFKPIKDTDCWNRAHKAKAIQGLVVDKGVVAGLFEAHRKATDEASGIRRLPFPGDQTADPDADPLGVWDPA